MFKVQKDDAHFGLLNLKDNTDQPYGSIYTKVNMLITSDPVLSVVLCIYGYTSVVFIQNETIYFFDPHSQSEEGEQIQKGNSFCSIC